MKLLSTLIALAALTITVPAVNIRHYRTALCTGNFAQCSNVPNHTCCILIANESFNSSQFRQLPTLGIAAICHRRNNSSCAVFRKLGLGDNVCLPLLNATGGYWVGHPNDNGGGNGNGNGNGNNDIKQAASTVSILQDSGTPTSEVMADVLAIDGHEFGIGPRTPPGITRGLVQHFIAESRYEDIPEEYKAYELASFVNGEG